MSDSSEAPSERRYAGASFLLSLLSLVAAFFCSSLEGEDLPAAHFIVTALVAVAVIGSLWAAEAPRWVLALGLPAILASILADYVSQGTLDTWYYFQRGVFQAMTLACIIVVLRHILTNRKVTADTIYGAITVYLLLAVFWAFLYGIVERHVPGHAFNFGEALPTPGIADKENRQGGLFYFSCVTLSTLGYGDIQPTHPVSRTLATLEAFTGQLYLGVLVARLVALHIVHSGASGSSAQD